MTGVLTKTGALTDLEAHVAAEGRAEQVQQVRARIKELGIQYIYYQFISVTGRIVGKGVPADHWEAIAEKGIQLVYGATANLAIDRYRNYIGYGPEAAELVAIARPGWLKLHWWRDRTSGRTDGDRLLHRQLLSPPLGHRPVGPRLC